MALANKHPRRTSDFQGVQRAQAGQRGSAFAPGTLKKKNLSIKAPTNAKDISAVLRALRQK